MRKTSILALKYIFLRFEMGYKLIVYFALFQVLLSVMILLS